VYIPIPTFGGGGASEAEGLRETRTAEFIGSGPVRGRMIRRLRVGRAQKAKRFAHKATTILSATRLCVIEQSAVSSFATRLDV